MAIHKNRFENGQGGALIVNADDWGLDRETTDRILECFQRQTISSTSAMVFMADSERAAELALKYRLDAGLHVNLTTPPSASSTPTRLIQHYECVSRYLLKNRLSHTIFHPGLAKSFEYLVSAQVEEFAHLYGKEPEHIDGHHHMHLCANVVFAKLLPAGVVVRRNFTFFPGEKGYWNRLYRRVQDSYISRRNPMPDYLFELSSAVRSGHLERICSLSRHFVVEIETHPSRSMEYKFLTEGGFHSQIGDLAIAPYFLAPWIAKDLPGEKDHHSSKEPARLSFH